MDSYVAAGSQTTPTRAGTEPTNPEYV